MSEPLTAEEIEMVRDSTISGRPLPFDPIGRLLATLDAARDRPGLDVEEIADLRRRIAVVPWEVPDTVQRLLATLDARDRPGLDVEKAADDVRHANPRDEYWRGFNHGVGALAARVAAQQREGAGE